MAFSFTITIACVEDMGYVTDKLAYMGVPCSTLGNLQKDHKAVIYGQVERPEMIEAIAEMAEVECNIVEIPPHSAAMPDAGLMSFLRDFCSPTGSLFLDGSFGLAYLLKVQGIDGMEFRLFFSTDFANLTVIPFNPLTRKALPSLASQKMIPGQSVTAIFDAIGKLLQQEAPNG